MFPERPDSSRHLLKLLKRPLIEILLRESCKLLFSECSEHYRISLSLSAEHGLESVDIPCLAIYSHTPPKCRVEKGLNSAYLVRFLKVYILGRLTHDDLCKLFLVLVYGPECISLFVPVTERLQLLIALLSDIPHAGKVFVVLFPYRLRNGIILELPEIAVLLLYKLRYLRSELLLLVNKTLGYRAIIPEVTAGMRGYAVRYIRKPLLCCRYLRILLRYLIP